MRRPCPYFSCLRRERRIVRSKSNRQRAATRLLRQACRPRDFARDTSSLQTPLPSACGAGKTEAEAGRMKNPPPISRTRDERGGGFIRVNLRPPLQTGPTK
jgi:hypothetical protein